MFNTDKLPKKFVFRIDGSTAPFNIQFIFNQVKAKFPEAKKEEKQVGTFAWDCYITVHRVNEAKAFELIRGFASQTMHAN